MKYNNIINELFLRFPMLKAVYEDEGDYIEGLQHLCYSIVFVPFIKQTYLKNDVAMIQSICDFMECMINSEDELVSELLVVSVLEMILSEREMISCLKKYLGPETLRELVMLEEYYGWTQKETSHNS